MDSMRTLNTSLPRTSPRRQHRQIQQPPEDLLSAFKQAALSVTTLYKSAASLQAPARAAGYQEAIEELLNFLDKQNIGLGDGEGWRIRQWATERLDGTHVARHDSDEEDEEQAEQAERADSVPADVASKDQQQEVDLSSSVELPPPQEAPAPTAERQHAQDRHPPPASALHAFTFRSQHPCPAPKDVDMDADAKPDAKLEIQPDLAPNNNLPPPSMKFDSPSRPVPPRRQRLATPRSNTSLRTSLGSGAGSKRKAHFGDFFDLSGINFDGKDGFDRGGKRGRHA